MAKTIHSILVVDDNPAFPGLVKVTGDCNYDIRLEEANSPEIGIKRLKSINPPAIVWSIQNFTNSNIDGKKFLNNCRKISPLSSRILCGSSLSKDEMAPLINTATIHSFYNSSSYELAPMLTSLTIGIEFHKVNILEYYFSDLNHKSIPHFEEAIKQFSNIDEETGKEDDYTKDWIDFDRHKLELTQLFNFTRSVINQIPIATAKLKNSQKTLKKEKKSQEKINTIERIQKRVAYLENYLTHSENSIERRLDLIAKTDVRIAEREEEIKKLKDEFMDE